MFYRPGLEDHGLPHNPFNALITPRPIGWISSIDNDGQINLAPYSFFNGVAYTPPMVMFSTTQAKIGIDEPKDSLSNIRDTGEFVVNIVSEALTNGMNTSSVHFPKGTNEFQEAELAIAESQTVKPPRVALAPAALECKLIRIEQLPGASNFVTFGEVTGIYISDDILTDGMIDITKYHPLARMGYQDYTIVKDVFSLKRPDQ